MFDRLKLAWTLWGFWDDLQEGHVDTSALVNLIGSALLAGGAGALAAFQGGATNWKVILSSAGATAFGAFVQHLRQSPLTPPNGPLPKLK